MPARKYIIDGEEVDRYDIDLFRDAGLLGGYGTGSVELYGRTAERLRQALEARLNDWDESLECNRNYDNAVKAMCEAALKIYAWREEQNKLLREKVKK